jgi:coenzyme PQQ precursor peptide PqqA
MRSNDMEQWTTPDFEEVPVNSECTAYSGVAR